MDRFKIKYSYAGIAQYADICIKDGLIVYNTFHPRYTNRELIPEILPSDKIEDVLNKIGQISYNEPKIISTNGIPCYYVDMGEDSFIINLEEKIKEHLTNGFIGTILPFLIKNNLKIGESWTGIPIIVEKVGEDWDNLDSQSDEHKLIDFICDKFLRSGLGVSIKRDENCETGRTYTDGGFSVLWKYIDEERIPKEIILEY